MTKLRIMSDLHLEFADLVLEPIGEDILVLAGDIGVGTQGAIWAQNYSLLYKIPVVYVAGNHEFYRQKTMEKTILALQEIGGINYLEQSTTSIGNVTFLGTTLWTDYLLYGERSDAMQYAGFNMNDHRLIKVEPWHKFTPTKALGRHTASKMWLEHTLPVISTPKVIITHHAPSTRSIASQFAGSWLNPAFASNLDELVEKSDAVLWIHGHCHARADYCIGNTRVMCNPRGYPGEITGFDVNLMVEM